MNIGEIAGLIGSIAFLILALAFIIPAIFIAKFFNRSAKSVDELTTNTVPLLNETTKTVEGVNAQLENIDTITSSTARSAANIAAFVELFTSTIGKPIANLNMLFQTVKGKMPKSKFFTDTASKIFKSVKVGEKFKFSFGDKKHSKHSADSN